MTITKPALKEYKFGEIAFNISERVEPQNTDLDIYVGLEHLDPEDIHIRRNGHPSQVEGTKLRVYPGDIIFGKRRAYQRKAAIVEFNGICSAHAMVIRANPETVAPEFLPFFMHSDVFMNRAIEISEGSLSPTIKWKILAAETFKLPPLNEQKRIAELMQLFDSLVEKIRGLRNRINILNQAYSNEYFSKKEDKRSGVLEPKELREYVSDFIVPMRDKPKRFDGAIPWCRIEDFDGPYLSDSKSGRYVSQEVIEEMNLKIYPIGTVLVSCSADLGRCAITAAELVTNQTFIGLVPNSKINNKYLYYYMQSKAYELNKLSTGTTIAYLSRNEFERFKVRIPDLRDQEKVVNKLDLLYETEQRIVNNLNIISSVRQSIINESVME